MCCVQDAQSHGPKVKAPGPIISLNIFPLRCASATDNCSCCHCSCLHACCWINSCFCFHRHMRIRNTTKLHLWPSCIVSLPWLSHKLYSPSAIPTGPTPLITHATVSLCLNLQSSQPYAMALPVTLMLCCTSRFILASYHPHTQQTWPVGFPYTFQSSSHCTSQQIST